MPVEVFYVLWGLVGGAALEVPSRQWRRVLLVAVMCGLGLLVSGYVGFRILPLITGEWYAGTYPERAIVFQQILNGIGLGLAIGLLIRRGSAIGLLVVLGIGVFMVTRPLNQEFFHLEDGIWAGTVRGALIGLVLGFGYCFMSRGEQKESKVELPGV